MSVDQALHTKGALLFYFSREPTSSLPAGQAHVAISLGNGRTVEAKGTQFGVGEFSGKGRFNFAGVVPGLSDPAQAPQALASMTGARVHVLPGRTGPGNTPFEPDDWKGKRANADAVRKRFNLGVSRGPLFAIVSRLVHQKGVDLTLAAAESIVAEPITRSSSYKTTA